MAEEEATVGFVFTVLGCLSEHSGCLSPLLLFLSSSSFNLKQTQISGTCVASQAGLIHRQSESVCEGTVDARPERAAGCS